MLALADAALDRDAPISEQPLSVCVPSITSHSHPGLSEWLSYDDGQGGNPTTIGLAHGIDDTESTTVDDLPTDL
jgi:hypothetical protein